MIAAGELFSVPVIRSFRGFAFWLLLMALFELRRADRRGDCWAPGVRRRTGFASRSTCATC